MKTFDSVQKRVSLFGVGALMIGSVAVLGAGSTSAHEGVVHPAHIHAGACAAPGDVVFPLSNVGDEFLVDDEPMAGDVVGSAAAIAVDVSVTTVQAPLADIVAADHSIVVHESEENIGNYVLCGDIGGAMLGDSDLPIGLGELNGSGATGTALLHDNGDGTTTVSLYVTMNEESHEAGEMDDHDMGTPAAEADGSGDRRYD